MNVVEIINKLGRKTIELIALDMVCACWYYELADNIDCMSESELLDIINLNYGCEECGLEMRK